jgi:predicted metal-dependent peptidase
MPLERFNIRMFCFDTKVYETNMESRKLYGFGGTAFTILEKHLQKELRSNPKMRHPEAIFVVTDGAGDKIAPEKPKNWHWILTPGGTRSFIPATCNFHDLADYE